jgi:hypothetical protein
MNLETAVLEAQREANQHKTTIAVVHDPITNAEESGEYGYCPQAAVDTLYRFGTIVQLVQPQK